LLTAHLKVLFDAVQILLRTRQFAQPRHSRPGKTASQNDDLNLLEDPNVVASLTHIIGICFERVPEVILVPFAITVSTIILREYPEACARDDFEELAHIISQFEAPGRIGENDQGVYVCHWAPLKPDERKKLDELRGAADAARSRAAKK
jgi:hypothetical protein